MEAGSEHGHWNPTIGRHPDKALCPTDLSAVKHSAGRWGENPGAFRDFTGRKLRYRHYQWKKSTKEWYGQRADTSPTRVLFSEAHPALPCRPPARPGPFPFPPPARCPGAAGRAGRSLSPPLPAPSPGRYKPAEFPRPVTAVRWWLRFSAPSHPLSRFVFPRLARAGPAGSRLGKVGGKLLPGKVQKRESRGPGSPASPPHSTGGREGWPAGKERAAACRSAGSTSSRCW